MAALRWRNQEGASSKHVSPADMEIVALQAGGHGWAC